MKTHEELFNLVPEIKFYSRDMPTDLLGLTIRNTIYLSTKLNSYYHAASILAEEVAHYRNEDGEIYKYKYINNRRKESDLEDLPIVYLFPLKN